MTALLSPHLLRPQEWPPCSAHTYWGLKNDRPAQPTPPEASRMAALPSICFLRPQQWPPYQAS